MPDRTARIVSVHVGRPQIVIRGGRRYSTAFDRRTIAGAVRLGPDGFDGDRVSDSRAHGGPDKVACCFPQENYAYFAERLGRALAAPSFGENLTTDGLLETAVCIGDTFQIGGARVQVSQPRQPCHKLADWHGRPEFIAWVIATQRYGFYCRVLGPGDITAGDTVALLERPHPTMTVAAAMRALFDAHGLGAEADRWLSLPELSATWKRQIERRLARQTGGDEPDE